VDSYNAPSRFIQEIPAALVEELRPRIRLARSPASGMAAPGSSRALGRTPLMETLGDGMRLGTRVRHGKFGEGVVLTVEGQGPHARVQVNFEQQGSKWLMLQYANLEVM
jgi:DNA helicase II / ATP-dependent DNA helicase PcrA